jgi:hypothetical protein
MLENKGGKYAESFSEPRIACKSNVYKKMEKCSVMGRALSLGNHFYPTIKYTSYVTTSLLTRLYRSVGALPPRTGSTVQKLKVLSELLYSLLIDKETLKFT